MLATSLEDIDHPDFLALNKDGKIVLIAEVKGFPFNFQETKAKNYAILRLFDYLRSAKILIPFAMLVDVNNILIFRWNGNNLSEPIISLNTADVLINYAPKFRDKRIFSLYLKGLIEAWVGDLSYHWKSETEIITLNTSIFQETLSRAILSKHIIDKIILECIIYHANLYPQEMKIFLSSNSKEFARREVTEIFTNIGVQYFNQTQNFLGWFQSQSVNFTIR